MFELNNETKSGKTIIMDTKNFFIKNPSQKFIVYNYATTNYFRKHETIFLFFYFNVTCAL